MDALLTKSRVFNLFVVIGNNGSSDGKYFYTLMDEVYENKECVQLPILLLFVCAISLKASICLSKNVEKQKTMINDQETPTLLLPVLKLTKQSRGWKNIVLTI